MLRWISPAVLGCFLLLALLTGCSRDPKALRQKYFASGEKYFAQGKYREATIEYLNAIKIDPKFAQAHSQLGEAYFRLGDQGAAFRELTRSVELDPNNYRAHTDLANLLVTVRKDDGSPNPQYLQQAKDHLDVIAKNLPSAPETHEAWSNYYAAENDLPSAMKEIQQAIALDPSRSEAYLLQARLQLRSSKPSQAEDNLKKAIQLDPKNVVAEIELAGFYWQRNRFTEAEQQFRQAIEADANDTGPRAGYVQLLMQEGKTTEIESFLGQTKKDLPDNSQGYRMLGDYYFATRQTDKAVNEYASLLKEHPKDPLVKKNYIQLLILKNRLEEAGKLNDDLLKSSPHDADALIYKGQIQMRQGNPGGAVESFQNALRNDAGKAVGHYQLGLAFAQQNDFGHAGTEWREAVRLDPKMTDAQRALASLELRQGDLDGLLATTQQIIQYQPNSEDGYVWRCVVETMRGKYGDAQKDAEKAMQLAPQSPAPYVQMGNIHLAQKEHAEALRWYQQALDHDPSSGDGLSGIMNTYFARKEYDKAIVAAKAQIQKSPDNSAFYDLLGTALFNGKKDLPGAETALRKSIELDKNDTDAIEKLGKVLLQEKRVDEALALYQQGLQDNPGAVRLYILVGELYSARQNWEQAKTMYQRALSLEPDQPLAANNLAYVILEQDGNIDIALAMAQTARRAMPDSPNAADTLGWAFYQKGVYQSAIEQFQEARRLAEKQGGAGSATIHYHLAMAYEKTHQLGLARQELEKARKIDPNNAEVQKALSELKT